MLIGIAGKAGSGKDTLANYISFRGEYTGFSLSYYMESMLEPVILTYTNYIDWNDREWKERVIPGLGVSPRRLKQTLGTEWRDAIDSSKLLWCKILERNAGEALINKVVIPDIRFEHEQDWVHSKGGIIVCVERDEAKAVEAHISENSLNPHKVDIFLKNNSSITDLHTAFELALTNRGIKL